MTVVFETERLALRLPAAADAAELARFYGDNRDHLQPWSPTFSPALFTERFWLGEVAPRRAELDAGRAVRGFLFRRDQPATAIGTVSLTMITRGAFQAATLGYALAEDAQGHGYMLEGVRGAVAHAFERMRLHRVMANYIPRNRRSAAVLRRAGFSVEGYAPEYLMIDGRWEDHILTAITNQRWRQA